ncbi:LacI family DNA-binding transcriptional regulator [Candidatus Poriferisodalis sp.]|uniref:LacI family DNA-binding transcriptional regulator n=1 Tax=Candidatus Poriferisodalis sp. TaxID=3101277 RepID=UPI003B011C62
MDREATLHDVAGKVGVSPRTVSRVVNDEGGYSEETRRKVMAAVEELHYRPNMVARALITKRSGTVGLVGGDMTDPYFGALAEGIQQRAREAGQTMFFASTRSNPERQAEVLRSFWARAVDGVIVFPALDSIEQLTDYGERGLPIVVVDDFLDAPNVACVSFDLHSGGRLAARHLLESGRRRMGVISTTVSPPRRRHREQGFVRTLEEAQDGRHAPAVSQTEPTVKGGEAGLAQLLSQMPDLDGVFAYNDLVAIGAVRAAVASGRRVPEDIAVVGCDDIEMSTYVTPALTTIRLDRSRLSTEVVAALGDLIESPGERREAVVLGVELAVRESA